MMGVAQKDKDINYLFNDELAIHHQSNVFLFRKDCSLFIFVKQVI